MQQNDMLYITCINSVNIDTIHRKGDLFLSSKRRNELGYGLASMHRIVNQAEGMFHLKILQEKTIAEIILPLRGEFKYD